MNDNQITSIKFLQIHSRVASAKAIRMRELYAEMIYDGYKPSNGAWRDVTEEQKNARDYYKMIEAIRGF